MPAFDTTPEGTEWFVLPSVWREDVCRGFDMVALNRELVQLKILNPGPGGKALHQFTSLPHSAPAPTACITSATPSSKGRRTKNTGTPKKTGVPV